MKANIELLLLVKILHIDIKKTHDCKTYTFIATLRT